MAPPLTVTHLTAPPLILASTSRYRRELLERLRLPFEAHAPGVDETEAPGESPRETALRLAREKARALSRRFPHAVVIGSDQIAEVAGTRLNKPGDHANAVAQLRLMSGRTVHFHSAMAVTGPGREIAEVVPTLVRMRTLADDEIERYLRAEQPYDCAGSAKSEGLGIALIDAIESDDPTALIGLPLIRLCAMLREFGYVLP